MSSCTRHPPRHLRRRRPHLLQLGVRGAVKGEIIVIIIFLFDHFCVGVCVCFTLCVRMFIIATNARGFYIQISGSFFDTISHICLMCTHTKLILCFIKSTSNVGYI